MQMHITAGQRSLSREAVHSAEDDVYASDSIIHLAIIAADKLENDILVIGGEAENVRRASRIAVSIRASLEHVRLLNDRTASFLSSLDYFAMTGKGPAA